MMNQTESVKSRIDPVCGMSVNPGMTKIIATIEGRQYYFCAEGCRKAFEENPEKYTGVHSRKGWWGRYLAKLNKSTDGKAIKCH